MTLDPKPHRVLLHDEGKSPKYAWPKREKEEATSFKYAFSLAARLCTADQATTLVARLAVGLHALYYMLFSQCLHAQSHLLITFLTSDNPTAQRVKCIGYTKLGPTSTVCSSNKCIRQIGGVACQESPPFTTHINHDTVWACGWVLV